MLKNFSIFKNKEVKSDKQPTHSISANVGTQDKPEYITIGACWTKEGKAGKFLSCKLQDVYVDKSDRTKTRKGFAIADEALIGQRGTDGEYPEEDINPEDIPF